MQATTMWRKRFRHKLFRKREEDEAIITTRSGCNVRVPAYLRENYETSNVQNGLTAAEENYYAIMASLECGFPCVDGVETAWWERESAEVFVNTNELHTLIHDAIVAK
jgi:hypothetical protein